MGSVLSSEGNRDFGWAMTVKLPISGDQREKNVVSASTSQWGFFCANTKMMSVVSFLASDVIIFCWVLQIAGIALDYVWTCIYSNIQYFWLAGTNGTGFQSKPSILAI